METRWLYTTSEHFDALREASKGTCVIPMGCLEKHGLHLPVGTDVIEASTVSYEASKLESFCVFPDFVFGDQGGPSPNMPAGTIALTGDLILELLYQLCDEIARNGFHKIVICNSHGGNRPILSHFARHLSDRKKEDYTFACYDMRSMTCPRMMGKILEEQGPGSVPELTPDDEALVRKYYRENMRLGHACMGETALVMGAAPESVHLDQLGIESGQSRNLSAPYHAVGLTNFGAWKMDFPDWFEGDDPVGCNERIGKAAIRLEAEQMAKAIKLVKEDDFLKECQRKCW